MQGKNLLTPHMGSIFNADEFLLQKWLWKKHTTLFRKNDLWFFSSHFEGQMVFISSVVTWVSWVSTLKTSAESLIMSRISISSVQSSKLLFWLLKKGENMICFSMYLNERKKTSLISKQISKHLFWIYRNIERRYSTYE